MRDERRAARETLGSEDWADTFPERLFTEGCLTVAERTVQAEVCPLLHIAACLAAAVATAQLGTHIILNSW